MNDCMCDCQAIDIVALRPQHIRYAALRCFSILTLHESGPATLLIHIAVDQAPSANLQHVNLTKPRCGPYFERLATIPYSYPVVTILIEVGIDTST